MKTKLDFGHLMYGVAMAIIIAIAVFFWFVAHVQAQTSPNVTIAWDWDTATTEGPDGHGAGFVVKRSLAGLDSYIDVCTNVPLALKECTDIGITGSATYKYIVAAYEAEALPLYRFGDFSEPFTFTFASVQPSTPAGLISVQAVSTTPGRAAATILWGAVTAFMDSSPIASGTASYKLFQSSSATAPGSLVGGTSGVSFTVQGLKKNDTFYFSVVCVVGGIESQRSTPLKVLT